ncbi:MAG: hypothetical protein ACI84C_002661 [Flavobacteriales bacterium]|jgi:hypothetical protein
MNIRILKLMLLGLIVIGLGACKDKTIRYGLAGKVKDNSGQVLGGVNMVISEQKIASGSLNTNFSFIANTTSNSKGEFLFDFPRENTLKYKVELEKDGFFFRDVELNVDRFTPGETVCQDFTIYPKGTIKIKIVNAFPVDQFDLITYKNRNADFDCFCCDNNPISFVGVNIDTNLVCDLYAEDWIHYEYQIEKYGGFIFSHDSVYVTSGDTTLVTINY